MRLSGGGSFGGSEGLQELYGRKRKYMPTKVPAHATMY